MAFVGNLWPDVDEGNKFPYTYDFAGRIPAGDTISVTPPDDPKWTLVVAPSGIYDAVEDRDAAALNALITDKSVSNVLGNKATAWVEGLKAGVRYKLTVVIKTTSGIVDDLYSFIRCNAGPPPP